VTTLTGLLFGTVPAWRSTQTDANATLKETGRMSTSRPKAALGKALVVVQIALSLLLIVGAGLFLQTLFNLHHAPTGMQTDHVILFALNPPKSRFTPAQRVALFQRVARGLSQIPGVEKSTSSEEPMLASGVDTDCYRTTEMPGMDFTTNSVGADFFETFGIPILAGRSLSLRDDQHAPRVAVINQTLAMKIYPGHDPVGHSIVSCDTNAVPMEIVGVSADSKFTDLRQSPPPTIYIPFAQAEDGVPEMTFEVRTAASIGSIAPRLRQVVHDVDNNLPVLEIRTQTEQIKATLQTENIFALLTSGFGVLAILLASIGIYGVMAYAVARRTNEIGIRMALGAEAKTVLRMVLGETTMLAFAGIAAGLAASLAATRVVSSMLFGVGPTDAVTFGGAATLLLVVALVAAFVPAWRAATVDPMHALRHD
jgi:predicted permease